MKTRYLWELGALMSPWRSILVWGFAIITAACAGTFGTEPFLSETIEGNDFSACLARAYQEHAAAKAYVDGHWRDAARFADRGKAGAEGKIVFPWDPAEFALGDGDHISLTGARVRLMRALDSGGRLERPCACAQAQRYYDGWLEQAGDGRGSALRGRQSFEQVIVLCEGVA